MNKILFLLLAITYTLIGCGGGNGGGYTNNSLTQLDCTGATAFDPVTAGHAAPLITDASGTSKNTTIILTHGKTAVPYAAHYLSFQTDMAALGYKVIAPYMTWSTTTWRGSLCESMAYINQLAQAEIDAGQSVVLAGHSMGGAYALMYGVTQPAISLKAIITIAPGHFIHLSNNMQTTTAADVTRAKDLENNGMGDVLYTFVTLNNGSSQSLSTTATSYLSYHDRSRVPAIADYASNITMPVLWMSGSNDSLTTNQNHAALAATITSSGSDYQLIASDHLGIVALTPDAIDTWLSSL
ncbi:MAG: alpha/beta hydrolase [Gammaproteobacteria bacterium]|nr:alpha/beta hydrolase [Gammaproteobacteria bacterium]